jgi:hypothetical protein
MRTEAPTQELAVQIPKDSIFKCLNNESFLKKQRRIPYFNMVVIINKRGKRAKEITEQITTFAVENREIYKGYELHYELDNINILNRPFFSKFKYPFLMVNTDKLKDFEREKQIEFYVELSSRTVVPRTKKLVNIILKSDSDVPYIILKNADFILIPKKKEVPKQWEMFYNHTIRY